MLSEQNGDPLRVYQTIFSQEKRVSTSFPKQCTIHSIFKKTALQWHIRKLVAKHNKSVEYRDTRCPCEYINRYHKYDIKVNRVMAFTLTGTVGRGSII